MRDLWTWEAEENQALVWPCSVWYHSGQWACFWPCLLTVPWNAPLEQCKLHWNRPDTVRQQCSLCVELSRLAYSWCSSLSSELQLWANKSKLQHCVAMQLAMLECMDITRVAIFIYVFSFMRVKHEGQLNGPRNCDVNDYHWNNILHQNHWHFMLESCNQNLVYIQCAQILSFTSPQGGE